MKPISRIEYYKKQDTVYIKTYEDGIFKDIQSVPLDKVDKSVLDGFNGGNFYIKPLDEKDDGGNELKTNQVKDDDTSVDINQTESNPSEIKDYVDSLQKEADAIEKLDGISSVPSEEINDYVEHNVTNDTPVESTYTVNTQVWVPEGREINNHNVSVVANDTTQNLNLPEKADIVSGTPIYDDGTQKKCDDFLTAVNKPSHYQGIVISGKHGQMEFEAIEIIDSVVNMLNFNPATSHAIGDALKYVLRCGKKDSDNNTTKDLMNKAKQDLLKSSWYLTKASETL